MYSRRFLCWKLKDLLVWTFYFTLFLFFYLFHLRLLYASKYAWIKKKKFFNLNFLSFHFADFFLNVHTKHHKEMTAKWNLDYSSCIVKVWQIYVLTLLISLQFSNNRVFNKLNFFKQLKRIRSSMDTSIMMNSTVFQQFFKIKFPINYSTWSIFYFPSVPSQFVFCIIVVESYSFCQK